MKENLRTIDEKLNMSAIPPQYRFLVLRFYNLGYPQIRVDSLGQMLDQNGSKPVKNMRIDELFEGVVGRVTREYVERRVQQQLTQLPSDGYNVIVVANSSVLGSIPAQAIRGQLRSNGVSVEETVAQLDGYGKHHPTQAHALLLPGRGTTFLYHRQQSLHELTRPR